MARRLRPPQDPAYLCVPSPTSHRSQQSQPTPPLSSPLTSATPFAQPCPLIPPPPTPTNSFHGKPALSADIFCPITGSLQVCKCQKAAVEKRIGLVRTYSKPSTQSMQLNDRDEKGKIIEKGVGLGTIGRGRAEWLMSLQELKEEGNELGGKEKEARMWMKCGDRYGEKEGRGLDEEEDDDHGDVRVSEDRDPMLGGQVRKQANDGNVVRVKPMREGLKRTFGSLWRTLSCASKRGL